MKRVTYLLSIIGAIAVVVGIFYFLRYRAEEPAEPGTVPPGGLPIAPPQKISTPPAPTSGAATLEEPSGTVVKPGEQKFGLVAHNEVISYFVDDQNNALIVQPDGQIVKIVRGEASVLSSSIISDLMTAEFSYDGKRILASFGARSNPQYSVFNVETKSWKPLASGIKSAAWSPTNYRIAYFKEQGGSIALMTLDLKNEKAAPKEIMKIRIQDADILWLDSDHLLLSSKPSAMYAGSLWRVDIAKRTLTPLVTETLGLDSIWSPDGATGLVFKTDLSRRGGRLSLIDAEGNSINDISFLTLPSKCSFALERNATTSAASQKLLYCAVPNDQEELAARILPDEYAKRAFFTKDNFYQINLKDGAIKEILSGQLVDGYKLKIFGKNLFFINRLDGKLYAISLE